MKSHLSLLSNMGGNKRVVFDIDELCTAIERAGEKSLLAQIDPGMQLKLSEYNKVIETLRSFVADAIRSLAGGRSLSIMITSEPVTASQVAWVGEGSEEMLKQ